MKNKTSILLTFSFVMALAFTAQAGPVVPSLPDQPVELTYAGSIDNNPVYLLELKNKDLKGMILVSISDKNGVTLYRENVSAANFSRKFLINRDELGNDPVRIDISFSGEKRSLAYEVNSTSRTQTENTVTRIF